jgi:uncharacterized protein YpmB
MKALRIWVTVILLSLILAAIAMVVALYNNLNSQWQAETAAAQYALNHSPISHIDGHSTFTGDGLQEVFQGTDLFHQKWYAFVWQASETTHNVAVVAATSVVPQSNVTLQARKTGLTPRQVSLGYVNPASDNPALKVSKTVVWEVYGTTSSGKHEYEYFDGTSGKLVWKYMLST